MPAKTAGVLAAFLLFSALSAEGQAEGTAPGKVTASQEPASRQISIEEDGLLLELLRVRRVYIDRLTGGETAAHLRDMLISALQQSKLFLVTENQERADTFLRGSGEDLIFTDTFQSSEGINARASVTTGAGSGANSNRRGATMGVGQQESTRIAERKHEAMASVRLVNKDGDVIWSTTQESQGGKFRGASADVADKVVKKLADDLKRARELDARKRLDRPPSAAASTP